MADHKFEPLRPWHPSLNTTASDKHVSEIERHIRTIKDSTRNTYRMLPFRHLPRIVLHLLVKNTVFWLNALPTNDGITRTYSPCYIMTGQHILASKHAVIEFGAYARPNARATHQRHESTYHGVHLSWSHRQSTGRTLVHVHLLGQKGCPLSLDQTSHAQKRPSTAFPALATTNPCPPPSPMPTAMVRRLATPS
jgi:hypothetical protein